MIRMRPARGARADATIRIDGIQLYRYKTNPGKSIRARTVRSGRAFGHDGLVRSGCGGRHAPAGLPAGLPGLLHRRGRKRPGPVLGHEAFLRPRLARDQHRARVLGLGTAARPAAPRRQLERRAVGPGGHVHVLRGRVGDDLVDLLGRGGRCVPGPWAGGPPARNPRDHAGAGLRAARRCADRRAKDRRRVPRVGGHLRRRLGALAAAGRAGGEQRRRALGAPPPGARIPPRGYDRDQPVLHPRRGPVAPTAIPHRSARRIPSSWRENSTTYRGWCGARLWLRMRCVPRSGYTDWGPATRGWRPWGRP